MSLDMDVVKLYSGFDMLRVGQRTSTSLLPSKTHGCIPGTGLYASSASFLVKEVIQRRAGQMCCTLVAGFEGTPTRLVLSVCVSMARSADLAHTRAHRA